MNSKQIIVVVGCGMVAIFLIVLLANQKDCFRSETPGTLGTPCVCAFDLDHTLSCGDPRPLVAECKAKGCVLAINTARPTKFVSDIPLTSFGLTYDPEDHHYQPHSYLQTPQKTAEIKSHYLGVLRDKYSVRSKSCVILFDDARWNLEAAKSHGFSTVAASDTGECGLHHTKTDSLRDILRRC